MTDIRKEEVERLARHIEIRPLYEGCGEESDLPEYAADTLRALRAELDRSEARVATLEGALRPFSDACKYVVDDYADDYSPAWAEFFEIGQFRRARAALTAQETTND